MSATIYTLDQTPVLSEVLETGDTVTCAIWNKGTGASVALSSAACTEIAGTGIYRYTVAMTTPPTSGKNTYIYRFTGTLQKNYGEFNWIDDEKAFTSDAVHIDTTGGGFAGTAYPIGAPFKPVDNIADARTIANRYGYSTYVIRGNLTLPSGTPHVRWRFLAQPENAFLSTLTMNNCDVTNSHFDHFTLTGQQNGFVTCHCCRLTALTQYQGHYTDIALAGNITQLLGGQATFVNVTPEVTVLPTVNVNGTSGTNLSNVQGAISLAGQTGGTTNISFTGFILVQGSNTAGDFRVGGTGYWVDLGSGLTITADATLPAAIWNRELSKHQTASTFGYAMNQIAAQALTETTVASGSTSTQVRTALTQANDYFNNMIMVVREPGGTSVARNIDRFTNTNGALYTYSPLPFTPTVGQKVLIVSTIGTRRLVF